MPRVSRRRWPNFTRRLFYMLAGGALILVPGCASIGLSRLGEPAAEPRSVAVFVVSTRKGEHGASSEAGVANGARFSLQMIGVPPGHEPGKVERPAFGSEDPQNHFIARTRRGLDETGFFTELASHISGRIGSNRDVLLYVHGFNTSYDEARFRLAQIVDDARFGGVAVLYTWPAAGSLIDYGAAKESATIARDALSRLLHRLSDLPDIGRVHILAHSMGAWLAMEALRENAISGSPDLNGKLGDVMLAAPDIDLNVFRQQLARLDPSHVFVLVASNDRALAGDRQRLGALDPNNPSDRAALEDLGVKAYDLSREFDRSYRARHLCQRTPSGAHDWRADHRTAAAGCQCPGCARRKTCGLKDHSRPARAISRVIRSREPAPRRGFAAVSGAALRPLVRRTEIAEDR